MLKILFWMNIPSHHQRTFFEEVNNQKKIDIKVIYYDTIPVNRKKMGWDTKFDFNEFEKSIEYFDYLNITELILSQKERIHIVPGFSNPFLKKLIPILINNKIKWIHWSEKSGKPFTKLFKYNYKLINYLLPSYHLLKGYKSYANKINNYALGAFAISKSAKKDFIKWGVDERKIKILNYSLKSLKKSSYDPLKSIRKGDFMKFIYVGVLTPHKGIHILIKAFSELKNNNDWLLVLVGNDLSNGFYKKMVKKLNLERQIFFLGTVESRNINQYIDNADVFILPTLFDGWGAVLNEAASLKKPLISTNQCGAAFHLIEDGKNGFRVKAKSVVHLKKALQFYIDHASKISKHGLYSYELYKKYTPKSNAELLFQNLTELLK